MDEHLTAADFHTWKTEEFIPHLRAEGEQTAKLQTLATKLEAWIRTIIVAITVLSATGSATVGLFFYILNDRSVALHESQEAVGRIVSIQSGILARIEGQAKEIERLAGMDAELMRQMMKKP